MLPTAGTVPSEYQACRFSIDLAFGQSPPTAIGCCRIGNLHAAFSIWGSRDYNEIRPHSKLGWMTPGAYASSIGGEPGRGAALRQGSAPRPLATHHPEGSNQPRTLGIPG